MVQPTTEFNDVERAISRSVQTEPDESTRHFGGVGAGVFQLENAADSSLIVQMAQIADDVPPWGRQWRLRDRHLRAMVHAEQLLGGAIYTSTVRNSSLKWELEGGGPALENQIHDMLETAHFGAGWQVWAQLVSSDLYGTDNGAFIEMIRGANSPTSPVIGIAHLDSNRCVRTGFADTPVIFEDEDGRRHLLNWWQVINLVDNPSPIKTMRGMQICAVSRALRGAQMGRDIFNFRREKMGGRRLNSMHIVSGISRNELDVAMSKLKNQMDTAGFTRYMDPLVLTTLDPDRTVSNASVDFASIPDGFNLTDEMTWWVVALSLAFGMDYQDIAPLQQGNLGNSQQSVILDRKSRGKAPAAFMSMIEAAFNHYGVVPANMIFRFIERDPAMELEEATTRDTEMRWMKQALDSGALQPAQAQAIFARRGWILEDEARLFDPNAEKEEPLAGGPGGGDPSKPGLVAVKSFTDQLTDARQNLEDLIHQLAVA